jgi:hypothetical protein
MLPKNTGKGKKNWLSIDYARACISAKVELYAQLIQCSPNGNFANIRKNINIRHRGFMKKVSKKLDS